MSARSNPGTGSQALESKISDTTEVEDKSQNRVVIEWLSRRDPASPFLVFDDRVWTYGETLAEVKSRLSREWMVLEPKLDPDSVFAVLAGIAGAGLTVLPPTGGTGYEVRGTSAPSTKYQVSGTESEAGDSQDKYGPTRLIVFTSGSTGHPRGVRLTARNLEAAAAGSASHLGHGPADRWLLCLPLHHVAGISVLVRSAFAGGSVAMTPGFTPESAARAMRAGVTMVSMVPTMLARTLGVDSGPYTGLRAVILGGGPIPDGLLEQAAAVGVPALPSYGMTETFGQVATLRPGSPPARRAHPLPGIELRTDTDGRIAIAGHQVSPGYLGEPDRSDRWLVTNDRGEIDEEGAVRVFGRMDSAIVSGGENVDPIRVEVALTAHPEVDDAVVVGVPDDEWGALAVCLYTGQAEGDDLAEWLRERIPAHHVPRRWIRVDALPATPLGKPDRAAAARLARRA